MWPLDKIINGKIRMWVVFLLSSVGTRLSCDSLTLFTLAKKTVALSRVVDYSSTQQRRVHCAFWLE